MVILAGGLGTRLGEETAVKPKPMVEIGGYPILWHIMQIFSAYGYNEFVVALGYKAFVIKDYFLNFQPWTRNFSIHLGSGKITYHEGPENNWIIHLIDTGYDTQTGGRILKASEFIGDEPFMLTYGDGVANIDIGALVEFHKTSGKLATLTTVRPPARFGTVTLENGAVSSFQEKPQSGEGWINGGFFVLEPEIRGYIRSGDRTMWESEPLENLAKEGQLAAYQHDGFWQSMDTLRDVRLLESLWQSGAPPWKVW
ncbi:MAG: glucose-1-phosphate cytidylyltransferase [Chloroflexota bacterium]